MILLDTTVLIYAVGDDHPLREPCRRVLRAHGEGRISATTTVDAVQEFVHVRSRRRSRSDAVSLARRYATAFPLLLTRPEELDLGLSLYEAYPSLGAFAAPLAAVALNAAAEALVSADRAFGSIPHLRWIDPASPAIDGLISP